MCLCQSANACVPVRVCACSRIADKFLRERSDDVLDIKKALGRLEADKREERSQAKKRQADEEADGGDGDDGGGYGGGGRGGKRQKRIGGDGGGRRGRGR